MFTSLTPRARPQNNSANLRHQVLVHDEVGRDQSLFYRVHRQGQTLQGISPKEGWSMVFSEDHESSDILAVDACPGLPVVHLDPSSVGQQESTLAHWRDPQFTQQPGGQRSVCGAGIYRRFYVQSVHAVHAGNPQRPIECSHRGYLSFAHYASYLNPRPTSLTWESTHGSCSELRGEPPGGRTRGSAPTSTILTILNSYDPRLREGSAEPAPCQGAVLQ